MNGKWENHMLDLIRNRHINNAIYKFFVFGYFFKNHKYVPNSIDFDFNQMTWINDVFRTLNANNIMLSVLTDSDQNVRYSLSDSA